MPLPAVKAVSVVLGLIKFDFLKNFCYNYFIINQPFPFEYHKSINNVFFVHIPMHMSFLNSSKGKGWFFGQGWFIRFCKKLYNIRNIIFYRKKGIIKATLLYVNEKINIDGEEGVVLAISYSNQIFYYIQQKDKGDWYCETDFIIKKRPTKNTSKKN